MTNGDTKSCGCFIAEVNKINGKNKIHRNCYEKIDAYTTKVFFNNTKNFFICDTSDWEVLKDYTWFETEFGYARSINKDKKFIFFHDVAMDFIPSSSFVCDHIDRNRLNNTKENLRIVSRRYNAINRSIHKNNTSGCTGVYRNKEYNYWYSLITVNRKSINLGRYSKFEDAVKARHDAERKYFKGIKSDVS